MDPPKAYSPLDSGKKKPTRDWLTQKHVSLVKAVSSESKGITDSAKTILDEEDYFVKEVDRYLNHNDFLNLRKKEIQYKKWLERVSEPLLHKIEDKVDSQSSEEIEERKRNQLALYLNYCNKKGNVVFEDYDASEYDPFFLKTHTNYWKVSTPPFKDPLLKEVQGKSLEKGIIQQCETGRIYSAKEMNELHKAKLPPLPLGRQRWDAVEWLKIAPGYIDSEVHQRKRRRMTRNQNKGTLDFKAWSDTACLPILWKEGMHIHQVRFGTYMLDLLPKQVTMGQSVGQTIIKWASKGCLSQVLTAQQYGEVQDAMAGQSITQWDRDKTVGVCLEMLLSRQGKVLRH
ncbi:protein FAM228B isoform X9 [Alligator mississippiensis]|uniref:protein FAM228B isoform X9 n=1 Tax=Alligator mississippiensis TaxID=8496 RepID=UPI000906FFFF|nr:protein FAM228B isoform X9 [Alligator mississippiensis]